MALLKYPQLTVAPQDSVVIDFRERMAWMPSLQSRCDLSGRDVSRPFWQNPDNLRDR